MSALCGMLGNCDTSVVQAMAKAMSGGEGPPALHEGPGHVFASRSSEASVHAVVDGVARSPEGEAVDIVAACRKAAGAADLSFQGAFSAVVDLGKGRGGWLLRDRLGRKPLFYYAGSDYLLFASELRALLASGRIERHLDLQSVDRYLTLRCVPGPDTMIRGVRRVQPGHVLQYRDGALEETAFAGFDFRIRSTSKAKAVARLREKLGEAAGSSSTDTLLWSGGLDCSALAALHSGLRPLSVRLEGAWQNDRKAARETARRLSRPLEEVTANKLNEEGFCRAVSALDEPIADPSVLPLWLLFESVGKVASRVVSGHGADELLGGYPRYHLLQRAQGARALVPVNLLSGISPALPPNAFVRRGSRYLANLRANPQSYLFLLSVFEDEEREALYTEAMKSALYDQGGWDSVVTRHFDQGDLTRDLLSLDLRVTFPDLLLAKCNSLAAAHGVEVEYPYLDDRLIDFATSLSPRVKFGVRSKPLLRAAMRGLLPGRTRLRARQGFQTPHSGRLVHVIESFARHAVTRDRVEATGLFQWPYVEMVMRSADHNVYRRRQYWALLVFFAWYREIMEA